MRAKALIPFIPYIVVSVVHVVLGLFDLPGRGFETKQLLMAALALAAVWAAWSIRPWPRTAMILVLIAMAGSWIGDGAGLLFPALPTLPMMILFFGIAHIAYIVLFWRAPGASEVRGVPRWALVYIVWWIAALAIVGPHSGSLFIPLAIYGLVLGGTAALSTRFGPLVATGGAFFLLSDTLIAFQEFMDVPVWLDQLVMPTYELGQGL
ncbi:MAG: lysoplasmalogenase, partial [Actinobacteria bacterium]|nr:lysoplasmalogenase [Actinomycetota bacterium]